MEKKYQPLEEGREPDSSLDLDGPLCEEYYGKGINEDYCVEELSQPLGRD